MKKLLHIGLKVLDKLVLTPFDEFVITPLHKLGLDEFSSSSLRKVNDRYVDRKYTAIGKFKAKKERMEFEKSKTPNNKTTNT